MDVENGNLILNKLIELVMNWFNVQSNPKISKLWGRIENDLDPADYNLVVYNSKNFFFINQDFPESIFSGKKSLVITTLSTFGGKNFDFAIFMLVVCKI